MTQKAEITFEVEETVVLKQGGKIVAANCPRCLRIVDMVSPDILALISGSTERDIFRLMESGIVHFEESGRVVVCPSCYQARPREPETVDPSTRCGDGELNAGRNGNEKEYRD
jgi:hypothetical protein